MQLDFSNNNTSVIHMEGQGSVILFDSLDEGQNMFYYVEVSDIEGSQIWFDK